MKQTVKCCNNVQVLILFPRANSGLVALFMLTVSFFVPGTAWSQIAQELLKEAESEFKTASFQRSLKTLRRVQAQTKDNTLLARVALFIGLNNAVMGRQSNAISFFRQALKRDPTLVLDAKQFKPSLVDLLEQVRSEVKGQLVVRADQHSAEVFLDGQRMGLAPTTLTLPVGKHQLKVVTKNGRWAHQREVVVRYMEKTLVAMELDLVPEAKASPQPSPQNQATSQPTHSVRPHPPKPSNRWKVAGWVLVGLGASSMIVGSVLGGLVSAKSTEHQKALDEGQLYEDVQQIAKSGRRLETAQYAMLITGASLTAVGAGVLIWSVIKAPSKREKRSWLIQPLVSSDAGGLLGTLHF